MTTLKKTTIILLALLAIFFLRGLYMNNYHSLTSDEPVIYTGLALWKTGDFALSPTHPPGMKLLMAAFTLPLGLNVPIPAGYPHVDEFLYGRLLVFQYNQQIFQSIIFWSRLPSLLLGILAGFYVYRWAVEITNRKSAIFAVALYAFCPLIVAYSAISDNDIMITAFFIMTLYHFKKYIQSGETTQGILTGLFLGIALLSKHTGILLIPIMFITAAILLFTPQSVPLLKNIKERLASKEDTRKSKGIGSKDSSRKGIGERFLAAAVFFVFIGVIAALVVNAGYFFQGTFTPMRDYQFTGHFLTAFNNPAIGFIPVPLPFWYLKGFETSQIFSTGPHYFMGAWLTSEDWYFFIFSVLVKTPLAMLIMLIVAFALFPKLKNDRTIDMILIMLTVVGITLFFSLSQYKLGVRHLLPIYPLIFIFLAMLYQYAQEHLNLKRALYVLFAWYLISSVAVHPHYLSYFNELIGGSANGYKYFLDSNVDWGQDLNAVTPWMNTHGISEVGLSYFGSDIPALRGINTHIIPCNYTKGVQVLSVNNLYGYIFTGQPQDCYTWLRNITPAGRIGYSMLVFNIQ